MRCKKEPGLAPVKGDTLFPRGFSDRVGRRGRLALLLVSVAALAVAGACAWYFTQSGGNEGQALDDVGSRDVDVIVYGSQTSGLAAARELALRAPYLKVALISSGEFLETPLAQGLCVEDARNVECVSGGFYEEWRGAVRDTYARTGVRPQNASGRFVYEPAVAIDALWSLLGGEQASNLSFYSGKLVLAHDGAEERFVQIELTSGSSLRLNTRYFVDASVEGDLARKLGAGYRVGRGETIYNDLAGPTPAFPSPENNYVTAPQRFSALLTLSLRQEAEAPAIADLVHEDYDPASYASAAPLSQEKLEAFATSWSMTIAVLPNGERELNENWTDWPDVGLSFQWVFEPERREAVRQTVIQWSINRVRYLQENGYPHLGIEKVPETLYVREGPRITGLDTYTAADLRSGVLREPVAIGCYVEYDRHDAFYPSHVETTRYARVPMKSLMVAGHPSLLVSTAISTDFRAYSSAVRMEHTRANMGGAAGAMIAVADRLNVEVDQVPYEDVALELRNSGYLLDVTE